MQTVQLSRKLNNLAMLSALNSANSILMCTHISPDGDAIGSMLAAGRLLKKMGKQVTMACADPVPGRLAFLPGAGEIVTHAELGKQQYDLAFALDAADEKRLGDCWNAYAAVPVRIQLDHHGTNPGYAQINEIDAHASSTGCLVYRLLQAMGAEMDQEMAECLYTAISTDTGNFCFSNTDEETFQCAAAVAATGFDINETARNVHLIREIPHVRLLGCALQSLRIFAGGQCACMTLTKQDFENSQASSEHSDTIVNYALNLPGIKMAYIVDLHLDGICKISFRAIAPYHVSDIAKNLGGGGHVLAAGCRTEMPELQVKAYIDEAMIKQIEEYK